jgi:hypothetical protein
MNSRAPKCLTGLLRKEHANGILDSKGRVLRSRALKFVVLLRRSKLGLKPGQLGLLCGRQWSFIV